MPETEAAIFEIVALLIAIPLSYVLAYLVKKFTQNTYEDEVLKLFTLYWNGEPEDELYAWYKVRMVLRQRQGEKRKIEYVNRKIEFLNKQSLYGSSSVDTAGNIQEDEENQRHED